MDARELLNRTAAHAADFLESPDERAIAQPVDVAELRSRLGGPLLDGPSDPVDVVDALVQAADQGIVATPSGRFFGFSRTRTPIVGIVELVERSCRHARTFAEPLAAEPEVELLNEVVLNQVLVRFGDSDERTQQVGRLCANRARPG